MKTPLADTAAKLGRRTGDVAKPVTQTAAEPIHRIAASVKLAMIMAMIKRFIAWITDMLSMALERGADMLSDFLERYSASGEENTQDRGNRGGGEGRGGGERGGGAGPRRQLRAVLNPE